MVAHGSLTEILRNAITLSQAAQLFSPVPHVSCVQRWCTHGCHGVLLKSWMSGDRRVTTYAAVEEFNLARNASNDGPADREEDFARRGKEAGHALQKIGA